MTTEVLAQSLGAGVQATFGQGRIWYIKTATGPMSVTAETIGSGGKIRKFINVGVGFKFEADVGDGWDYLRVTSASAQLVELVIGDDNVEISNAVSVIGSVVTAVAPSSVITASPADSVVLNATALAIPANLTRKRITIGSLSTNTGSVRVQSTAAGANKGLELQPGLFVEIDTTAAIDVRNDSGASQTLYTFEES
jgi:hypothetical protein